MFQVKVNHNVIDTKDKLKKAIYVKVDGPAYCMLLVVSDVSSLILVL